MAHLNLRERRIETTIAFVGPPLAGKTTNLAHLAPERARDGSADCLLSPNPALGLDDFEVRLHLLDPDLDDRAQVREQLERSDGIVFVADADPDALERNQSAWTGLRSLLSDIAEEKPLLLQVNKSDLAGALSAEELVERLDATRWPCVSASARLGTGVVESVEQVVARVIERLEPIEAPKGEAGPTPLVSALEAIVQSAVAAQAREIDERKTRALAARLEAVELALGHDASRRAADASALRQDLGKLEQELKGVSKQLGELAKAEQTHQARAAEQSTQLAGAIERQSASISRVDAGVRALPSAIDRLHEELREEWTRSLDARFRVEREHLANGLGVLRRSLDAMSQEVKNHATQAALTDAQTALDDVAGVLIKILSLVEPLLVDVRGLEPKLSKLGADLKSGMGQTSRAYEERIDSLRGETGEALGRTNKAVGDTHVMLSELIEELKKPKKGWFG